MGAGGFHPATVVCGCNVFHYTDIPADKSKRPPDAEGEMSPSRPGRTSSRAGPERPPGVELVNDCEERVG
jgi:hypothetical protein